MNLEAIDIFNHCLPPRFVEAARSMMSSPLLMFDRAAEMPGMCDLGERLRMMDEFPGYQQVLSLGSPAIEAIAGPDRSPELARIGNDAQAEWCFAHPEHADAAQTDLKEKPLDAFRRFYADTATFGSRIAAECGAAFFGKEKMLFATDFPFAGIEESLEASRGLGEAVLSGNARRLLKLPAESP